MPKFFAGLFLNASIISLLICVFRICRFVFSAFRLGPFRTNLYLLI